MKYLSQVAVLIFTFWLCDNVKCNPHRRFKSLQKSFHFELQPIPLTQFSLLLKKITPFGGYEIKHSIKKRQVIQPDVLAPMPNEVPGIRRGTIEDIMKIQNNRVVVKEDDIRLEPNLTPQVIITSIIKPIEDGEPFSVLLPEGSVLPTVQKIFEDVKPPKELAHLNSEVRVTEVASSSEKVIKITPKPKIEIVPPENLPIRNIVINTPVESPVQSISKIPHIQNPNGPFLFTDITRIPLSGLYPAPTIGVPEFIVPSPSLLPLSPPIVRPPLVAVPPPIVLPPPVIKPLPPLPPEIPPIVKEDIPIIREESPNFLVKGSRFVLYFGSMMLQMLSQLVNGRINLSQPIDIPLITTA